MAFPTNNQEPRLITVDESNGNTLTRATVTGWGKTDVESLYLKESGLDVIIASAAEGRIAGVKENALTDLVLSRHVKLKQGSGKEQGSVIQPLSIVPRENIVNANYFQIESGAAHPTVGKYWNVTINTGTSPWASSPSNSLKDLEKFFLPGMEVNVEYKDANEVARRVNMKVVEAVNATSGSTEKATITLEPPKSDSGWSALGTSAKAVFQPTAGQVTRMANSVSDYESWGHSVPGVNNLGLIEYWKQTSRWVHAYNEEYVACLNAPYLSVGWKKFKTLPLAKIKKQQQEQNDREMLETFFYGQAINENQTGALWRNLPQVTDPADPDFTIEYKSNTEGVITQLGNGGMVSDRQNTPLDLDTLFETCYTLKRQRGAGVIDIMTDRWTAVKIRDLLLSKYYKTKFGTDTTSYFQPGQKITFNGQTVLEYNMYDLPDQGVQMAVFVQDYFTDRLDATHQDQKSRSRALWAIDWSDVAVNVIKTNSAKRQTNVNDALYMNVIKPVMRHTMLMSKTFEVRVGDVNRHRVIENFSDATPKLTVSGVDLS